MNGYLALPLATTIVSLVFAAFTLDQFVRRRRPYQLVWTLALFVFSLASLARAAGSAFGWDEWSFKLWYGSGAYGAAALLGMGTAYLLLPRRLAHSLFALLAVGLALAGFALVTAPVDLAASVVGRDVSGAGLPAFNRAISAPFNIFGTVFFVGGAAWSGLQFAGWWPRPPAHDPPSPYQYFPLGLVAFTLWCLAALLARLAAPAGAPLARLRNRAVANAIIAAGGLIFAASGTLSKYFGIADLLYLSEFAGTIVIFAGFLVSIDVFEQVRIPFTGIVLRRRASGAT